MKSSKPKLKLVGQDGNAFMILGLANRAAKKAGWSVEKCEEFMQKAQSGDYNNLLAICMEYFDVQFYSPIKKTGFLCRR